MRYYVVLERREYAGVTVEAGDPIEAAEAALGTDPWMLEWFPEPIEVDVVEEES